MKEYHKIIGCRIEPAVFDYIKKIGMTNSEYLRKLIHDDIEKSRNRTSNEVNTPVNKKEDIGQAFDIHEQVDQFLKRLHASHK